MLGTVNTRFVDDLMVEETTTYGVQSMNYHVPSVVDGSGISIREWVPPPEVTTKATLQLTHGIAEHSGRYDRFGRFLAANGYRVTCAVTGYPSVSQSSAGLVCISGPIQRPI